MRRLKRFLSLTSGDRRLLIRALMTVGVARVALWILPFRAARRIVTQVVGTPKRLPVERLTWAVKTASPYLPQASCLTQALAAEALLTAAGHKSHIEIGVSKGPGQAFEAHA